MSANPDTAAPTGRNKPAQGKERSDAALGHASQNTSSPEGAKQGGELPRGWSEQRIEQLFAPLEDGRTLHQGWSPQCDKIPSPSEDVWGVLKTTSIQAGEFQPEHNKLLPPGLEPRPMIEVKEGDILLTCAGPRVRCGVSCLVRQTRKRLMMSGKMYRFRVNPEEHDARYIEAFLQTERARQAIDKMKTGSSDSGLNLTHERFRQLPVPVPATVAEQRRIVAEIEKHFTRLEAGVAALRRVQANLKRYRAAVLKAACEGRLVPTEAELSHVGRVPPRGVRAKVKGNAASGDAAYNDAPFETGEALLARILTERRQNWQGRGKYKEPSAPDTAKLAELPAGWTWANVEQLGDVQLGRQRSPKNVSKNYPTKYIRAANITERGIDVSDVLDMEFSPAERERFTLRDGDILLSEASGSPAHVGKPAVWRGELPLCCFQNTVLRLRPVILGSKYTLLVFQHFFVNSVFAKVAGGVGINHLGAEKFSVIPFPLAPLAEQTRIVAEVERRLSVVEELESVVTANLQRATRLRQSILQKAFTGQLA